MRELPLLRPFVGLLGGLLLWDSAPGGDTTPGPPPLDRDREHELETDYL